MTKRMRTLKMNHKFTKGGSKNFFCHSGGLEYYIFMTIIKISKMNGGAKRGSSRGPQAPGLRGDALSRNLDIHNVNRVLRHDNILLTHLENLSNRTRVFLLGFHE